jgi:hypothetical protein
MSDPMEKITIKAIRAVDSKEDTIGSIIEHTRVLEDIGVTSALRLDFSWCLDPETVLILAFHESLGMVGGCRIQYGYDLKNLPIYKHLLPFESDLDKKLGEPGDERCFELAGLWVAHRFSGHGLPWLLTAAAVSVLNQINAERVYCFAAEYSLDYATKKGFEVLENVGSHGMVDFPIPGIKSYVLLNRSTAALRSAHDMERDRLVGLRLSPDQVRTETIKDRSIEVVYRLKLPQRVISLVPLAGYQKKQRSA